MTTLPADELVERLEKRAAECSSASCHDDKDRFLNVVAKLTRSDGRLMAEAAAEISSLRAKLAEAMEVVDAAKGLCFGEDWNKGSHAIKHGYRAKLISAIGKMFPDHPCAARRLIEENGNG